MLMTYYCPTHGHEGRVEPIQFIRQQTFNELFEKNESRKDI